MTFYNFAKGVVHFFIRFKYKLFVSFDQEIPPDKGYILACNHQSNIDPLVLAIAFRRQVNYMAKEELFSNKILATILYKIGTFKVSRGKGDTSAIDNAIEIVKTNRVLGIFPEGTRSKDGKLGRAKSGAVVVASKSCGDIIPVGITYEKGKFLRKYAFINFGSIISNETLKITDNNRYDMKVASEYLMKKIAQLIERPSSNGGKITIRVAKTAGFCFGVNRAVNKVNDLIDNNKRVATLGPIIHNQQLVDKLTEKGVRIIDSPCDALIDETVVIRSHGVGESIYNDITKYGSEVVDATCPYVAKIHNIVSEASGNGKIVIILGDKHHPEIIGIVGHISGEYYVVSNCDELQKLFLNVENIDTKECVLVVQTTYNQAFWCECEIIAKKLYTKLKIFDTICKATLNRQVEAIEIAQLSDLMIIIGGRHSSNTKKLFQVCSDHTRCIMIETADELANYNLTRFGDFGVTAGASTPAYIIKEVLKTMSEILRNDENELDFATLLEQSLETEKIYNGKRVIGIVTNVSANEVHVDVGAKQAGIIPADEMTDDPQAKLEDLVKKGDEIELSVIKVNDQEGIVLLSKKRCDAQAGFENLKKAFENETVLDGVVTDVVRGGVLVYTSSTKLFVPASQCSDKRIEDLATLIKTNVKLKVIEINEDRNRAKGSIKAVLSQGRKEAQTKFWEEAEIGKQFTGEVKSLTAYGAFVDLGGIDGMIHITELSWAKLKHPSDVVKQGQTVEVYIKEMDKEKKRISLGYKNAGDDPWTMFAEKYEVDSVVDAKIVSFTAYGAFAEIMPGVDGLIHISQIANKRVEKISDVLKVGQDIQVKIIEIDAVKKRVSLSMRALLTEDEQKKDKDDADEAVAE